MADKDLSQKALLEYPDVFADIYNTLIFNGREILKPDELKQITTEYISNSDHKGWKQLFRDVVMENTTTGARYMILGIENQATPDYTMPLRGMGMDYAAYEKQLKLMNAARKKHRTRKRKLLKSVKRLKVNQLKRDKLLIPVITLVLYYGQRNWTGPRSLMEMIHLPDENKYPGIRKYIHDYGMNLVVLKDLSGEEVTSFKSDFKHLVNYLVNYDCPEAQASLLRQKEPEMDHHQETMLAMAALTGDRRYVELTEKEKEEEMMGRCKMLDYLEEQAIARGTAKGMAQGMAQGLTRGKQLQIIELVIKKCARGLSVAQIAEQVEENADRISTICDAIVECGSGCTSEMVYSKINS